MIRSSQRMRPARVIMEAIELEEAGAEIVPFFAAVLPDGSPWRWVGHRGPSGCWQRYAETKPGVFVPVSPAATEAPRLNLARASLPAYDLSRADRGQAGTLPAFRWRP